jgi:putative methyltransferase (TIGR04325 family)
MEEARGKMQRIDVTGAKLLEVSYEICSSWEEAERSLYPRYYWDTFEQMSPQAFDRADAGIDLLEVQFGATIGLCSAIAGTPHDPVRVLDVGGWYGEHYVQVARLLRGRELAWTILDTPASVEHARAVAPGAPVEFESEWNAIGDRRFDVVPFGGALQYLSKWRERLQRCLECGPRFVVFSRTHLSENELVFREKVVLDCGTFTLAGRAFDAEDLESALSPDFALVARWQPASEMIGELGLRIGGLLFERRE